MSTRFIEVPDSYNYYPVGDSVASNNRCITRLAVELLKYIEEESISTSSITLIGTGSSGAILCALLSIHLDGANILHIKKNNEDSHSHHSTAYISNSKTTLIFVDDFQDRGTTYKRVYNEIVGMDKKLSIACFIGRVYKSNFKDYPVDIVFAGTIIDY